MKQLTEEVYTGQGFMQGGWGLLNFVMGGEATPLGNTASTISGPAP